MSMDDYQLHQSIQLSDGRILGYAEYGSAEGFPIFYFTGGNSSRLEGQWFSTTAQKKKIRLIVPDRPGFGLSTFSEDRELLDWPNDLVELANALSLENFSIFGLSGGGPHTLATAFKIPERIIKVAIVSGTAPPEMPNKFKDMWPPVQAIFYTADKLPIVNRFLLKQMAAFYSNEEQMMKRMKQGLPLPDVNLIDSKPDIIKIFSESTKEAHRNGLLGDAWEWQLYIKPWGFQLKDIQKEIKLWYGLYDQMVPIGMGRFLAQELLNGHLIEVEDGGHFSTVNNYSEDILDYLIS